MSQTLDDPLARAPQEAREFYEQCAAGVLAVQRCDDCGTLRYYPRPLCTQCLSPRYTWHTCSGRGTVYTFTVIHENYNPRFRDQIPYVVAVVQLEEGVRMLTGMTGVDPQDVRVDMPVAVAFEVDPDGRTVPRFAPRRG